MIARALAALACLSLPLPAQDGEQLYTTYCAACHAPNGLGATGGQFPPLAGSDWLKGEPDRAIKIVLDGLQGPVEVAGRAYNLVMPPQGQVLSDANLAAILTHARTSWGNDFGPVRAETVAAVRSDTEDRNEPWTAPELLELHPIPVEPTPLENLTSQIYHGEWGELPDFDQLEARNIEEENDGRLSLRNIGREDHYGVVWEGEFVAEKDAVHRFRLGVDDGARVVVNGEEVVRVDGTGPMTPERTKTGEIRLTAGRHPFRVEYFEAAAEAQLVLAWRLAEDEAKWRFLSEMTRADDDAGHPSIPVSPAPDRAAVYRNFIAGTTPRAIGIGFPGGVNFAYSADHLAPELIWHGPFIDAGRHWTGRGQGDQPPAGHGIVSPTSRFAFPEGARFRGYHLDDAGNPTFKVTLDNLLIEDAYRASGGRLARTLKVRGKGSPVVIGILEDTATVDAPARLGPDGRATVTLADKLELQLEAPALERTTGEHPQLGVRLAPGESATLLYSQP